MTATGSSRDERLDALYAALPAMECKGLCQKGCHSVGLSAAESQRIKERHGAAPVTGAYLARGCPMLTVFGRCSIYPDRPLVCRLYGMVLSMPCRHGCAPVGGMMSDDAGHAMMVALAAIPPDRARKRGKS